MNVSSYLVSTMTSMYLIFFMLIPSVFSKNKTEADLFNSFQQSGYTLTPERAEVVHYNKNFINILEIKTFKYNRTTTAFNLTANLKFDVTELNVITQAYKFMSNEYRYFPLRIQYNVCKALAYDIAGIAKFPCGNFTGCSILKGVTYKICNWAPDQSKFPPLIPPGGYMIESQWIYHSVEVAVIRAYASITIPFARK